MSQNKEWIKLGISSSLTKLGKIEYGLIDEKEEYCYTHKSNYINEFHKTFNGEKWLECPKCREDMIILGDKADQQKEYQLRLEQIKQSEAIQQPTLKKLKGF